MKLSTLISVMLSAWLVAGCASSPPDYHYRGPLDEAATINDRAVMKSDERSALLVLKYHRQIMGAVASVNGEQVIDGWSRFMTSYKYEPKRDLHIPAGTVRLRLIAEVADPQSVKGEVPIVFEALPGEKYELGIYDDGDHDFGFWIEDSKGKRVASISLAVGKRKLF